MPEPYESQPFSSIGLNLETRQIDFLKTRDNQSKYVRWVLDQDPDYKLFLKQKKAEK